LGALRAHHASINLRMLRLGNVEVSLWNSGAWPQSSIGRMSSDEVTPAWFVSRSCEVGGLLEAANTLRKPSSKAAPRSVGREVIGSAPYRGAYRNS
jgi:hypothetical protein